MIVALDVGTSSVRAALHDDAGGAVPGRFHRVACRPTVTRDGGVEHDPGALLDAAAACIDRVLAGPGLPDVAAVSVATFWHGLLGLDAGGRPVTPVFMWGDTRCAADAALLRRALDEPALHARTGCHVHTSYWPAKLRWLARERPDLVARVARWGSFGEHLELTLFGEAATTVSMASGTGLLDQETMTWDPAALAAADVDATRLFPLCDRRDGRAGLRPAWARRWPALRGRPWFPAVGDGAASNVGSGCAVPARLALNVGTSTALRMVTPAPGAPPRGLWRYRLDRELSLLGGALSEGGNVYAWCRDVLRLPDEAALEATLAARAPDDHGLTVLPFVAGERAPGWRGERRAAIVGIGLDTRAVDIVAAAIEAVALRVALVYDLLRPRAPAGHVIVASGGAVGRSRAWARAIADALGRPLTVADDEEATGRGAAWLALEALGRRRLDALPAPRGEIIEPDAARHARYRDALQRQGRLDARLP